MPRNACSFRQRDVTAAVQGVVAAGIEVVRVEINGGTIVVVTDKRAAMPIERDHDLDQELAEFEVRNGKG